MTPLLIVIQRQYQTAIKAHEQLSGTFDLMSLSATEIKAIRSFGEKSIAATTAENNQLLNKTKQELAKEEELLFAVEEKWIKGQIEKDTYDRWYTSYSGNIITLKGKLEYLSADRNKVYQIFNRNLDKLTDMQYVYNSADILDKREIVKMVFDSNLYYQDGIYRTPTMLNLFAVII